MSDCVEIALIEDSQQVRRRFVQTLNDHNGWRVTHECADGGSALREIPRNPPDLILLDIGLGQSSGIDLIRPLRQAVPQVPIVMLTVSENATDIHRAIKAGACGYIIKSDAPNLLSSVEDVLADRAPVMSPSVARKLWALLERTSDSPARDFGLTARETEVLDLSVHGKQQGEIALQLGISINTVKIHRRRIFEKLGVASIMEASTKVRGERSPKESI